MQIDSTAYLHVTLPFFRALFFSFFQPFDERLSFGVNFLAQLFAYVFLAHLWVPVNENLLIQNISFIESLTQKKVLHEICADIIQNYKQSNVKRGVV